MLEPYLDKNLVEAGCDEAGRGCLAGPVVAAAVILPKDFKHKELNDSKKLSHGDRIMLRKVVQETAFAWKVAFVYPEEIDRINILNASFKAMHLALDELTIEPESLLIDGNRFRAYKDIPHHCIIKGDGKYTAIAAASILAKTYRDDYMEELAGKHPEYLWTTNKGYPTKAHRAAIAKHGATSYHRQSFRLLPEAEQGVLF